MRIRNYCNFRLLMKLPSTAERRISTAHESLSAKMSSVHLAAYRISRQRYLPFLPFVPMSSHCSRSDSACCKFSGEIKPRFPYLSSGGILLRKHDTSFDSVDVRVCGFKFPGPSSHLVVLTLFTPRPCNLIVAAIKNIWLVMVMPMLSNGSRHCRNPPVVFC